ncbi:hypothetical protein GHO26_12240 [Pseudomonas helleri]|uniref:hypothetical protein n=1 Tax=Pseudomonas helleri TaxID=1608996 RepID=UPI0012951E1E|nr:hypothetical protein [Pseudomonas helleri]MQU58549.1 hypothetical protein [Pseudomonas helleri]
MNMPHDSHRPGERLEEVRMNFDPQVGAFVVAVPKKRFIAPIPFDWMQRATALPGKTVQVALALCFLKGVKQSLTVKVTQEALSLANCSRQAYYQALGNLEQAGLVKVKRSAGQRAIVTLLQFT